MWGARGISLEKLGEGVRNPDLKHKAYIESRWRGTHSDVLRHDHVHRTSDGHTGTVPVAMAIMGSIRLVLELSRQPELAGTLGAY